MFCRKLKFLIGLMSADNSWSRYCSNLEKHQRSKTQCIPFFGQFLTALSQENSLSDLDVKRLQLDSAWGQPPTKSGSGSNLVRNRVSGTSLSLPDLSSSSDTTSDTPEPLHTLRLLPLTASQSDSNVQNLSESSIADSHQPTQTTLTELPQVPLQDSKQRIDSAAWESLQSSQASVDKNKQQQSMLNDSTLADSAIAVDSVSNNSSKHSPSITAPNEMQVDETNMEFNVYELATLEVAFESWDESVFNGSFLSSSGDTLSSSSLNAVHPEGMDESAVLEESVDSDSESESVINEDSMACITQEASYDSMHSEFSGILFAHAQQESAGDPPPWPITQLVGDQAGYNEWQMVTKCDPNLTIDKQVTQEYEASIRRVQEYWNQQTIRTPLPSRHSCNNLYDKPARQESFTVNTPPGLPEVKGSSQPPKGKGAVSKRVVPTQVCDIPKDKVELKVRSQVREISPADIEFFSGSVPLTLIPAHPGDLDYNGPFPVVLPLYLLPQLHPACKPEPQFEKATSTSTQPSSIPKENKEKGQIHTLNCKQDNTDTVFPMKATTPNLILLDKYKFFSGKYSTILKEKSKLRQLIEVAQVLTEEKQFLMSCQHEPAVDKP